MAVGLALQGVGTALAGASFLRGLRKVKGPNFGKEQDWINSIAPLGPTQDDLAAGERTATMLGERARASGAQGTAAVLRRARQRGLGLSPIADVGVQRVEQQTARSLQDAKRAGANQIYQSTLANKQFRNSLLARLQASRLGYLNSTAGIGFAQQSDATNSALEYLAAIASMGKTAGTGGPVALTAPAKYTL